jgi:Glycosyl hydrolases family 31 TIM-barrel domain/Glycosyl hydrolase family 31 C-terminal domain/Domain of unknown function (DUF5110)
MPRTAATIAVVMALLLARAPAGSADSTERTAAGEAPAGAVVVEGPARFEVLTRTLIRTEYASDGRFEDRTTFNVIDRHLPRSPFVTHREGGWRVIRTPALTLRYRLGSGRFTPGNLVVTVAVSGHPVIAHPWPDPSGPPAAPSHNLGGWYRSLDRWTYDHDPACPTRALGPACRAALPPLHDGLLSTDGWYLLDDTQTALWRPGSWPEPRSPRAGPYQDGYVFGYGHDYRVALGDLARLTGPAPLLPRWMFGVAYSGCCGPDQSDDESSVVPGFRAEQVPVDTLIVDTQWKTSTPAQPSTNETYGWEWNPRSFPRPQQFLDWAHAQGIRTALNVHPAIMEVDPRFAEAAGIAGGLVAGGRGADGWNWSDPHHARSYLWLHQPFERQGVDFWWLDWCCERQSQVAMPGLTPDSWVNQLYAEDRIRHDLRGFVLSRIGASWQRWLETYPSGAWADHRSAVHFTGDTWSTWNTLAYESTMTAREGNLGIPYVSHDIGGYLGAPGRQDGRDTDDLYARWVELGTFQPVLRLHGTGARLPWQYGAAARAAADAFLRLRDELMPYLYTTAREAYDSGIPMVRGLYLDDPDEPLAYRFDQEYLLGDELLVAPVTAPGEVASTPVWFPPGEWVDLFTGRHHRGPATESLDSPLDRIPAFVRAGSVLPMTPRSDRLGVQPAARTLLRVYAGGAGSYSIYDDAGEGLGYLDGEYARTLVRHDERFGAERITIGAAQGSYPTQAAERAFTVDLVGVSEPSGVRVEQAALAPIAAGAAGPGWWYDAVARTVHVTLPPTSTHRGVDILVEAGGIDLPTGGRQALSP